MLLGNLGVMGEYSKRFPSDCHPQWLFSVMAKDHCLRGIYYLDLYPFAEPMVFLLDPAVSAQVDRLPRHKIALDLIRGLAGTKGIFSTKGAEWLAQHNWFMPAFSISHIMTLVPGIVEETLVFREKLAKYAVSGDTFSMNEDVMRLTIDVIARSSFDLRLESQTKETPIFKHFQGAISWAAGLTDTMFKKVMSPYMMDYHTNKLDKLLTEYIKNRSTSKTEDNGTKTILDLALKGYQKEKGKLGASTSMMDPEFMKIAVDK
jgi:cytochrome P450